MFASRAMKPKLSLNVVTAAPISTGAAPTTRPALSLATKSPLTPQAMTPMRSPMAATPMSPRGFPLSPMLMSPLPMSPTARNTKMNARGFSTVAEQPTFEYANNASSKSILKKSQSNTSKRRSPQLSFSDDPVVHCVTPIEDPDYYGGYKKMSRDERRWIQRN